MSAPEHPNNTTHNEKESANTPIALSALHRAAQRAREEARRTGTAVVILKNGQVQEERPAENQPVG